MDFLISLSKKTCELFVNIFLNCSFWVSIWHPFVQMSRGVNFQEEKSFKEISSKPFEMGVHFRGLVQISERSFKMSRLSKKQKQEWDYFINPETGRRTYNGLCKKMQK